MFRLLSLNGHLLILLSMEKLIIKSDSELSCRVQNSITDRRIIVHIFFGCVASRPKVNMRCSSIPALCRTAVCKCINFRLRRNESKDVN